MGYYFDGGDQAAERVQAAALGLSGGKLELR
jgi:hypothetical protein